MSRSVGLPAAVDKSKASAKYDQEVLTLILPKEVSSGTSRLKVEGRIAKSIATTSAFTLKALFLFPAITLDPHETLAMGWKWL